MTSTQKLTIIALFTSLIIACDYALVSVSNVKLLNTLVFCSAYSFGFKVGASIALLSELIWGIVTPNGFGGLIIPFLAGGEVLFAVAGYAASKMWKLDELKAVSPVNLYFGALIAICTFFWDLETNLATGLLEGARTFLEYMGVLSLGIPFAAIHEASDFVLGASLAPIVILTFKRYAHRFSISSNLASAASAPSSVGVS